MFAIVVRPGSNVAGRDPKPGDTRLGEHDAQEGKASIARRGGNGAAEQQLAIGVAPVPDARSTPSELVSGSQVGSSQLAGPPQGDLRSEQSSNRTDKLIQS